MSDPSPAPASTSPDSPRQESGAVVASDVERALQVMSDIAASPTPYHAAQRAAELLTRAGFVQCSTTERLPASPGPAFVVDGGALVAWVLPQDQPTGYCIVGAHTDSPNLRVRANADITSAGWAQVGMEVYGGVLGNSWLDRDLGLAGRVHVRNGSRSVERLVCDDRPILRVPQLAIHLDRDIREKGLLLNPQQHLTPLWATGTSEPGDVRRFVADLAEVDPDDVLSWELMAFDTQGPAIVGRDQAFIASARIDNQLSCFAATRALIEATTSSAEPARVPVLVLYDHEEIGSVSSTGAAGSFLAGLLERMSAAAGLDRVGPLEAMARSFVISADGAHATHPNYADRHEPQHPIEVNGGIVIKRNANQRYATDAISEAMFRVVCADAGVPVQTYIHRNDLPCGSTIGPLTSAELAVSTVDVGAPQLAMHSIREMAGVHDVTYLEKALTTAWSMTDL